jgi:hypothetical protein
MAIETEQQEEQQQEQPQTEEAFASEKDLAKLFSESADQSPLDEDPEEQSESKSESPAPAPTVASPSQSDAELAQMRAELQQLRERSAANEARNAILQQRLAEVGKPQIEEKPEEFSFESFKEMAAKDPTGAIYKLFEQAKTLAGKAGEEATTKAKAEATATLQRQNAYESDKATLISEYGELLNGNKAFANLAEQIYNRLVANSPVVMTDPNTGQDVRWHNGAMYAAASMAYAQLHKNGQLQSSVKPARMIERKPAAQNPIIGDQSSDKAKTIASDIPPRELAIMKSTANKLGMPLEKFLKVYEDQKSRNPYYGSGV